MQSYVLLKLSQGFKCTVMPRDHAKEKEAPGEEPVRTDLPSLTRAERTRTGQQKGRTAYVPDVNKILFDLPSLI